MIVYQQAFFLGCSFFPEEVPIQFEKRKKTSIILMDLDTMAVYMSTIFASKYDKKKKCIFQFA